MLESIDSTGEEDPAQPMKYLRGVGTSWDSWLTGGLFGRRLSQNIQAGYAWLAGKCGLLKSADPGLVEQAYALYRDKKIAPEDPKAVAFRAAHSYEIRVRFIGVWRTSTSSSAGSSARTPTSAAATTRGPPIACLKFRCAGSRTRPKPPG